MYTPDFDQFCALARQGNLIPVYREILADLETPVSAFLKIDNGGDAFLLESVEEAEKWGRYSFLGVDPEIVFRSKERNVWIGQPGASTTPQEVSDPLAAVKKLISRYRPVAVKGVPPFSGGLVGYIGYDSVRFFERLPQRAADDMGLPDQYLMLVDTLLAFDNTAQKIKVVSHAFLNEETDLRSAYDSACAKIEKLIERLDRRVEAPTRSHNVDGPPRVRSNLSPEQYEKLLHET
jgi:anthranilate synthase component 1